MLPERVVLYGKDEDLPERRDLRAGPLTLIWEAGDLRTIRFEGKEVLRRIYVATRDRNWGTVPNLISNLTMEIGAEEFTIVFDVANRLGEIDFTWKAKISGEADGLITYTMEGVANTTFLKNRIGFCILHPAESAGSPCRIEHVGGALEEAILPVNIRPDQPLLPFAEMQALAHQVEEGVWAGLRFEGDIFEMEDQRNWTDASFKTFCTPLRIPYPAEVTAGTRISQTVRLRVEDTRSHSSKAAVAGTQVVNFDVVEGANPRPLPQIGLGDSSVTSTLNEVQRARLSVLQPAHLRVELWLSDEAQCEQRLRQAAHNSRLLGVGLEIALFLEDECAANLATLEDLFGQVMPAATSWIVYAAKEHFWGGTAIAKILSEATPVLRRLAPDAPIGSGTNYDLIFLLRNLPPLDQVEFLCYAIQPQAHAFDTWSVSETASCQAATVATAREAGLGKPVHVSPVTLKMRRNPYATAAESPTPEGEIPPQVDIRQMSLFAAGWTVASLKALAESGADSITFYETVGWRGVLERKDGSLAPSRFHSIPGGVFPLYHVLADVAELAGGVVVPSRSSQPLAVEGFVMRKDAVEVALLANVTPSDQVVELCGMQGPLSVRVMDARTAQQAMREPEAWRAAGDELLADSRFTLHLGPFAVAHLERAR